MVDDLLEVARIDQGKIELRLATVNVAEIVRTAIETSRPGIERHGHSFSSNIPSEPLLMNADSARLPQVVSNLLNNAAKYIPNGGKIELTVARVGDCVEISVRDSGIGLSADELTRVFDMFSQVQPYGSEGGLGIGLALSKQLVELHRGRISVASAGEGQGSEFTVSLPMFAEDECQERVA